jgi:hypothetical protein
MAAAKNHVATASSCERNEDRLGKTRLENRSKEQALRQVKVEAPCGEVYKTVLTNKVINTK